MGETLLELSLLKNTSLRCHSWLRAEVRRVPSLQHLAVAEVHVHTARQTGIEAAHGAHDVDALEGVGSVLLEDRRVLYRVFVGAGGAVHVARRRVPWRRRVGVVVRDL